jgi:hypothetical protein
MNELCVISNLTSSEWAAWVQAIGSIAAIASAVWIMNQQHKQEIQRRRTVEKHRLELLEQLAAELLERVRMNSGQLEDSDGAGAFHAYTTTLHTRLNAIETMPMHEIYSAEVISRLQQVLHWVRTLCTVFESAGTHQRSKETLQALENILTVYFTNIEDEYAKLKVAIAKAKSNPVW